MTVKIYIAKWCSCDVDGYDYQDDILSVHSSYIGAVAACNEYENNPDGVNEKEWTEIEETYLLP